MAIPLAAILSAAPGVISAAAEIIRTIKQSKASPPPHPEVAAEDPRIQELVNLLEQQAQVIENLAQANQQLALAVRNNRILMAVVAALALLAIGLALAL